MRQSDIYDIATVLFDAQPIIMEAYGTGLPTGFFNSQQAETINLLLRTEVLTELRTSESFTKLLDGLFAEKSAHQLTHADCLHIASQHASWLCDEFLSQFSSAAYDIRSRKNIGA